ncbi:MAG TPA: TetR/AcrR family transcriptional regulator [Stellaceae bacterium]|nr:TetR/AcrR family transcriptional regulator [Stellaceae bacterium]
MGWSGHRRGGRRGYHHGDLREALIAAATALIAEYGPFGFGFVDAARWAGVSAAAPYRHFRDRDELIAEVGRRGFEEFAAALERAWDEGRPDPLTALTRVGKAYLAFARDHRAAYAAMFDANLPAAAHPALHAAGERAFAVLTRAAGAIAALLPPERRPPPLMLSLHVWAMSHGIAALFARTEATPRTLPMSAEDLLEAGVLVYLRGLGLGGAPPP